ncbi:MAG TPA: Asp-tRNA(Asn)/Glu-tRNA(Gln) amidotransferase subunit GatC [Candidatus Paceibacterota bacterium]|nr:Asp-tRNA(Asn)/Glu-tRNA(Gln) amidotransferase subunit GatC [Candidatus Paceibacterota bacterium]
MEIKDIEKLAELAKLNLEDSEKDALSADLEGILGYIEQIREAKIDETDADTEPVQKNVWREDEARPRQFSREEILNQFPDSQDGFVKVKKIL